MRGRAADSRLRRRLAGAAADRTKLRAPARPDPMNGTTMGPPLQQAVGAHAGAAGPKANTAKSPTETVKYPSSSVHGLANTANV